MKKLKAMAFARSMRSNRRTSRNTKMRTSYTGTLKKPGSERRFAHTLRRRIIRNRNKRSRKCSTTMAIFCFKGDVHSGCFEISAQLFQQEFRCGYGFSGGGLYETKPYGASVYEFGLFVKDFHFKGNEFRGKLAQCSADGQ